MIQLEHQATMNYHARVVGGRDHTGIPDALIEEFCNGSRSPSRISRRRSRGSVRPIWAAASGAISWTAPPRISPRLEFAGARPDAGHTRLFRAEPYDQ